MKKMMIALMALAVALAVAAPALAEGPAPDRQTQDVAAKNLRTQIVKLKYVRAQDIQQIIYAYASREGRITFNPNMPSVLSVSDTPENVERILAAVREIDVKPADVLYTVQLVLGSESDAAMDADLKGDPIVRELGKLLRYRGYTLLDATLVRTVNRDNAEVNFGPKSEFKLALRPEVAGDAKTPFIKTTVRLRHVKRLGSTTTEKGPVPNLEVTSLIESSLNVKSGERTVVGVSKLDGGDKGLILIISAKIIE